MNKFLSSLIALILFSACTQKNIESKVSINTLPSPATAPSGEPYLYRDAAGDVYLSWIEKGKELNALKFSKLMEAEWSTPVTIASDSNWFVNWADYPMISKNKDHYIAHVLDKSGDGTYAYDVKVTHSDNGKSWTEPKTIHDDAKQAEHGFVSLLPYEENFLIVWLDGRNTVMEGMEQHEGHHGQMSLRAAIIDANGKKLKEWELDNRTCDCCQTAAVLTSEGPVVIYRDRSDDEIRDMSIVRLIDSTWTAPKPVYTDNWKIEGCPVNGPRMDAKDSTVAIAWFSMRDKKSEVKVIFSANSGETFSNAIQIDEGHAIGRVDLVMLDDKSVFVSWMEGPEIKVAKVYPDGRKESAFTIAASSESRSSGFPQMTATKENLILAWTNSKGKTIEVVAVPLSGN